VKLVHLVGFIIKKFVTMHVTSHEHKISSLLVNHLNCSQCQLENSYWADSCADVWGIRSRREKLECSEDMKNALS
jgi:hypothetical protein